MASFPAERHLPNSKNASRHGSITSADGGITPGSLAATENSGSALLLEKTASIHRSVHNVLSSAQSLVSKPPLPSRHASVHGSGSALTALFEDDVRKSKPPSSHRRAASTTGTGTSAVRHKSLFDDDKIFVESRAQSISESTWLLADEFDKNDGKKVVVAHSTDALATITQRLSGATVKSDLKDQDQDIKTLRLLQTKVQARAGVEDVCDDVEMPDTGWKEYFFRLDTGLVDMSDYQAMIFDQAHKLIRGLLVLFVILLLVDMLMFAWLLYKNVVFKHNRYAREVLSVINIAIDFFGLVSVRRLGMRSVRPLEFFLVLSIFSIMCTSLMYGEALFVIRFLYVVVTFQLLGYSALNSYGRFQLNVAHDDQRSRMTSYVILLTPRGEHAAACPLC
ncbi:hypothetical protein FVE85_5311 [Porphyridium purpureum]|uniref:Uncharacterized protein n=1 Tax=Porphyridium purpureum TaxID=35688 RepID=A0A5J4Z285_PORPP|nr:hypothetical protein FVE85_5311 [Porphyridium purpureum]|eukprot:POR0249..scf295_1